MNSNHRREDIFMYDEGGKLWLVKKKKWLWCRDRLSKRARRRGSCRQKYCIERMENLPEQMLA